MDFVKKGLYYIGAARDIRNKKEFSLFGELDRSLHKIKPLIPSLANDLLRFGVYTLYLMTCDPNRFLVGLKGGVHWKSVNIPANKDGEEPAVFNMATHLVPMLSRIGKRELAIVPESLIYPNDLMEGRVRISATKLTIDEILEDAYFRPKYLVPNEGADVRFRKAGHLGKMFLIKSGNEILAKLSTTYGDEQVILNLNDASYIVPDRQLLREGQQSSWASIVAETYHDLVTADEFSTSSYKPLRRERKDETCQDMSDQQWDMETPQVIYIPRITRAVAVDFRPPYDGPPRPIKPHTVTNYFRSGNMTSQHRDEIFKLEREWGLPEGEIADNVPAGKTWVRPHFSPRGSEVIMKTGPIFIKRRILAQTGVRLQPSRPTGFYE